MRNTMIDFPIVIMGMGPSGATASLFLSQKKIPHLILDKEVFPRDKICGDALSGKVFSHLKHVDPQFHLFCQENPEMFLPSYGVRFASPEGLFLDVPFSPGLTVNDPAPGFICRRMDFDAALANRVKEGHAEVWENAKVVKMEKQKQGWILHIQQESKLTEIYTSFVIGADGERGISRRQVTGRVEKNPKYFSAGLRQYFKGVTGLHPMNFIELHFIPELLPGYFWIFPMAQGNANVGLGMLSQEVSSRKINLRKTLEILIHEHPRFSERFKTARALEAPKGWGLPLGNGALNCVGHHLLLTGDAASLIDPFTGEGIGNAILSGRYAAQIAAQIYLSQDYSEKVLLEYPKLIQQKIGQELKVSSILLRLVKYPFLFNWVVRKANKNEPFRNTISSMFADIDLRAKFSNPMFYIRLLFGNKRPRT